MNEMRSVMLPLTEFTISMGKKHIRSYKIVIQHCHSCGVGKPWFYVNKESISSDLGSEIFPDEMPCKLRSDL